MVDSPAFEPVRKSSDHIAVAARANVPSADAQASRSRPAGGLLRPSQVPLPGTTTTPTGFPYPAGEPVHHGLKALRPSGAPAGAAPVPARPLTLPARPIADVLRGSGQPLAAPVTEEMQARFGADFSQVRVHTDSAARASAVGFGARAYTVGNDIVIGDGGADKYTLAHELTHVIQQRTGPVAGTDNGSGVSVSDPSDRFERQAEAHAAQVMSQPVRPRDGAQPDSREKAEPVSPSVAIAARAVLQRMGFKERMEAAKKKREAEQAAAAGPSAAVVPAAAAEDVPQELPADEPTYKFDEHGLKHFRGQDSQWNDKDVYGVNRSLIDEMKETIPIDKLWQSAIKTGGRASFYYTNRAKKPVGVVHPGSIETKCYVIQIEYTVATNEIGFHGYPIEDPGLPMPRLAITARGKDLL